MFRVETPGKILCNVGFYRRKPVTLGGNGTKVDGLNDNRTAHLPSSPNSGSRVADQRPVLTNVGASYAVAAARVLGNIAVLARRVRGAYVTSDPRPSVLTCATRGGEISWGWGSLAAGTLEDCASACW